MFMFILKEKRFDRLYITVILFLFFKTFSSMFRHFRAIQRSSIKLSGNCYAEINSKGKNICCWEKGYVIPIIKNAYLKTYIFCNVEDIKLKSHKVRHNAKQHKWQIQ